jgi:hypothetical protein
MKRYREIWTVNVFKFIEGGCTEAEPFAYLLDVYDSQLQDPTTNVLLYLCHASCSITTEEVFFSTSPLKGLMTSDSD